MGKTRTVVGMDTTTGQHGISEKGDIVMIPAIIGLSDTPTVTLSAAAGLGATVSIVGNNLSGEITLNTGASALATGKIMTFTFANGFTFPNKAVVLFSASTNVNFASVINRIYTNGSTTGGDVYIGTTALSLLTTYVGNYLITGW